MGAVFDGRALILAFSRREKGPDGRASGTGECALLGSTMLTAGGVVAKQGLDVVSEFEVEAEGGDGDWAAVGVEAGVVDELVIGGKEDVFG